MSSPSPAAVSDLLETDHPLDVSSASPQDAEIADWLAAHPEFFDHHADLLSEVKIRHPHGGKAISLVERQVLVMREKNRALEKRMAELIRIGQENDAIGARLQRLTRDLLKAADPAELPALLTRGLSQGFAVPQVAIRLWGIAGLPAPFGTDVTPDLRRRTHELSRPYCGPNAHAEAASWLPGGGVDTASLALVALRVGSAPESFGLLAMGSPDPARFQAGMGTSFLESLGEIASASLSRLLSSREPG